MSRIRIVAAAGAAAAVLSGSPARAADVRFDPTVDLSVYHDGNVRNVDKDTTPDEVARLGLNLDLSVRNPSSSWVMAYRPFREFYNDFSERDYTGHNASIRYARTGSQRSTTDASFSYSRTERQTFDPLAPDAALTYTPRSTFQAASLRVGGSVAAGRRSSVAWGVAGRMTSNKDIRDPVTHAIITDYNDSESGDATVGWAFRNSQRSAVGGSYAFQRIAYDVGPSTTVHTVAFTHSLTVGRNGAFSYGVGVLRGTTGSSSSSNASVNGAYRWTTGPQSSVSAGVRQSVSEGDGLTGATLDRGGYLTWAMTRPRGLGFGVTGAYWDRGTLNAAPGTVDPPAAFTISDNISFPAGRRVRLGLFHAFRRQSASDDSVATSFHAYGFSASWMILGARRTR